MLCARTISICPSCLRTSSCIRQLHLKSQGKIFRSGVSHVSYRQHWQLQKQCTAGANSLRADLSFSQNRGFSSFTNRTHTCVSLGLEDVGSNVRVYGWLQHSRMAGVCLFLVLRDWTGIVQVSVPKEKIEEELQSLPTESVVEVKGTVQKRPEGLENKDMPTGWIEIIPSEINILNKSRPTLPIDIDRFRQSKEDLRLQYRYLDLRSSQMQHNLRLRSNVIMKMREFLCQNGFVDVETPTLFRRTPGGAKEFVVPSHYPGKFYSLPQSPQQFKQLLMVGGLDRYFQIAKCYRDETAKPDRQPEFTQVDIELSFTTQEDVRCLVEGLLQHSWPDNQGDLTLPFPVMTYLKAMEDYGIDKPDTRFELKLSDISDYVRGSGFTVFDDVLQNQNGRVTAIRIPKGKEFLSNKEIENLRNTPLRDINIKPAVINVGDNKWDSPLAKHLRDDIRERLNQKLKLEPGDVVYVAAGKDFTPNEVLGRLRLEAAKLIDKKGVHSIKLQDPKKRNFLWITDFPMFVPKEELNSVNTSTIESAHHPFTAPHPEDQHLLYTDPTKVRSQHYDLVLNGHEIGGGSIRIHEAELQRYVLGDILKEDVSELEHLLEAFSYGAPPHGGIALGLDRLLACMCEVNSIRDVIAFPKSSESKDPMSKAPAEISDKDLELYHIQVKK